MGACRDSRPASCASSPSAWAAAASASIRRPTSCTSTTAAWATGRKPRSGGTETELGCECLGGAVDGVEELGRAGFGGERGAVENEHGYRLLQIHTHGPATAIHRR